MTSARTAHWMRLVAHKGLLELVLESAFVDLAATHNLVVAEEGALDGVGV